MDETGSYGQFCPVAMAAELICTRWTALVLRELLCGSTRFNDIRRGLPRMSPTLLSKRLKELEQAGVVEVRRGLAGASDYHLTAAGEDLRPVVMSLGIWAQRWMETGVMLEKLDPSVLMWDMRRHLDPTPMPPRRCIVEFSFPELSSGKNRWWLVIDAPLVDLCRTDPGFEVDLHVELSLRAMTAVWMGFATLRGEVEAGRIETIGDRALMRSMDRWLGLSPFAKERSRRDAAA